MSQVAQFAAASDLVSAGKANAVLFQWLTVGQVVTRAEQPGPPRIRVLGDDGTEVRALRHALDATGAEVVLDNADLADLTVAGLDGLLDVVGRVDQEHWLPVRMHGDEVLVGLMR